MWKKQGNIFSQHWAQLPIVDVENENFWRIYYSQRIQNKSYPKYFDIEPENPTNIINFQNESILELGEMGMFDQAGVMPAEIITHNGIKYLYYIGWTNRKDVPYHNQIGLALSDNDGKTFTKISKGPVLGTSLKEPGFTGTFSVLIENGIWRGWYLSCRCWEKINGIAEPFYDIKYAESLDGIVWEPKNITCINLKEDEGGISQASVIKKGKIYHMWFSVRKKSNYRNNKENSYKIYYAQSANGISWNREEKVSLNISKNGWDSEMVEYPYVIATKDKRFMFYNGNGFGKTGIGCAEDKIE